MSLFGLDSKNVLARMPESSFVRIPSLVESVLVGSIGFGLVSLLVFGTVAFGERWLYAHLGLGGTYALWTFCFVAGAGAMLNSIVIGSGSLIRFYGAFTLSFVLYAAAWMAAYFVLRGKTGEWIGSIAGTILMGLILCIAFGAPDSAGRAIPALVAGNLAGYFLGRWIWRSVPGPTGMLGWGIIYGVLFGLGLGYALYACQARVRTELIARHAVASPPPQT